MALFWPDKPMFSTNSVKQLFSFLLHKHMNTPLERVFLRTSFLAFANLLVENLQDHFPT